MPDGHAAPADLLNRAIALDRAGGVAKARAAMRHLADSLPDWDEPRLRLASSLRLRGEPSARAWGEALALNPNHPAALLSSGAAALEAGDPRAALPPLLRRCGLEPHDPNGWALLGQAYTDAGEPCLALGAYARAQRCAPREIARIAPLVAAALAAGRVQQEAARLGAIGARDPLNPVPHIGRGLLLERLGLLDPAIDALEAATALAPEAKEPAAILAGVLSRTSRARHAEAALRHALSLDPGNPQLMNDRAAVLMRLHRHAEARTLLCDVLWKSGPHSSVICNLANATACLGAQDEAVELARAAIAIDPAAVLPRRALANTMPYQDGVTGAALLKAARDCAATLPRGGLPALKKTHTGPLTVGLLSGTLRTHPVGWLTVAGFEHLDPEEYRIVCLSRAPETTDPIAWRFRTLAKSWEDVGLLDDDALARRARALGIDILIDLGGHGDAGRIAACARRLAPVQIKWVGMQNHSTGLAEMDWFLTDRWETPPELEHLYSERLLRMPDGYVCYSPPPHAPDVALAPQSRNGFTTFGCFNNTAKITARAVETWCEVLRALPDSRMILKTHQFDDPPTAARFRNSFARHGVDPTRIEARGSSPHRAFLESYNAIDIVLDPFPYSGGLTTCEALWMGVPTVTLPGEIFASRHSASHLSNAGYADWVAKDRDDYIAIALDWANRPEALAAQRRTMRAQVAASPLCDGRRFGRALGQALRHAWASD